MITPIKGNDLFQERSQKIVNEIVADIKRSHDINDLFDYLIGTLGRKRYLLANASKVDHADQFGVRRDRKHFGIAYRTALGSKYQTTSTAILDFIAKKLGGSLKECKEDSLSIKLLDRPTMDSILELIGSYVDDYNNQKDSEEYYYPKWIEQNSQKVHAMNRYFLLREIIEYYPSLDDNLKLLNALKLKDNTNEIARAMTENETCYQNVLSAIGEDYHKKIVKFYNGDKLEIAKYVEDEVNKNSRDTYVAAKIYLQIGEEKVVAAQYLTWLNSSLKEDPLERMKCRSKVWICHLSTDLISKVLKDIQSVFCKAIQCNDLENLIPLMGEFRFKFAFACPYQRGSASIAEWFEKAIYLSKDYELSYKDGHQIDLKAFETPCLPPFLEKYPNYIELKKL